MEKCQSNTTGNIDNLVFSIWTHNPVSITLTVTCYSKDYDAYIIMYVGAAIKGSLFYSTVLWVKKT